MSNVYIVNKSGHDFSAALEYGDLTFLSDGVMKRYAINNMYRQFKERLKNSGPEDWIVPCSLSNMNIVACSIFVRMHGRLNLLLYKDPVYIKRVLILNGNGGENGD
jgi:hypothetical protein